MGCQRAKLNGASLDVAYRKPMDHTRSRSKAEAAHSGGPTGFPQVAKQDAARAEKRRTVPWQRKAAKADEGSKQQQEKRRQRKAASSAKSSGRQRSRAKAAKSSGRQRTKRSKGQPRQQRRAKQQRKEERAAAEDEGRIGEGIFLP